jgi:hypothetical protein
VGQTEVSELRVQVCVQQNVLWFEVTVVDPAAVEILQRGSNPGNIPPCFSLVEPPGRRNQMEEVTALAVLHDDEGEGPFSHEIPVAHNSRVVEAGQKLHLLLEPTEQPGVLEHLERYSFARVEGSS